MRDVRTLSLGVIRQGHRRQGFFHAAILTLAPHLLCRLVLAQADVDWVAAAEEKLRYEKSIPGRRFEPVR